MPSVLDYSTATITNAAFVLASSASPVMPVGTHGAMITVETDQVRWRADGSDPSTTEGHLLENGDSLTFDSWSQPKQNWNGVLRALRFYRVTNDAKLKITWFD